jgi:hypothetical protein
MKKKLEISLTKKGLGITYVAAMNAKVQVLVSEANPEAAKKALAFMGKLEPHFEGSDKLKL